MTDKASPMPLPFTTHLSCVESGSCVEFGHCKTEDMVQRVRAYHRARALTEDTGRLINYGDVVRNPVLFQRDSFRAAAVMIVWVDDEDAPQVLLTKRSHTLSHHPGQISFPGGACEATDAGFIDTALRETQEEVGIASRHIEVIGCLDIWQTGTGFAVTPVVGVARPPLPLHLDKNEVAEAFTVPTAFLLDHRNHLQVERFLDNRRWYSYAIPWQGYKIWGATAGILRHLTEVIQQAPCPAATCLQGEEARTWHVPPSPSA